jgi:hypothetical protein
MAATLATPAPVDCGEFLPEHRNRLKTCRGKPFDLWNELELESQKGNLDLDRRQIPSSRPGSERSSKAETPVPARLPDNLDR